MNIRLTLAASCAAAVLASGAASAAFALPRPAGAEAPLQEAALLRSGTPAGNAKQRHRTRLDRCRKMPSRC